MRNPGGLLCTGVCCYAPQVCYHGDRYSLDDLWRVVQTCVVLALAPLQDVQRCDGNEATTREQPIREQNHSNTASTSAL